jgi:hypothetical protein
MKFISVSILTSLLAFAAGFVLPWWSIAPVAFVVSLLIPQKPVSAFFSAFAGLVFLWGGLATYIDVKNRHLLAGKIADLFFQHPSHFMMIAISALIGGLVAGLAALSAAFLRNKNSVPQPLS